MPPSVGDLIMEMRALGPDLPQVFPPPTIGNFTFTPVSGTPSLGAGTYFIVATALNQWGETLPSAETSVSVAGGQVIQVSGSLSGATAMRFYISGTSGNQENYVQLSSLPANITASTAVGAPPQRNTAYLPDTDGGFVSVSACYRWLNESLDTAARITEGIPAMSGVNSIANQRRYVLNGQWLRIDHGWFNGWELTQGTKADAFFNRNVVAGISNSIYVDEQSDTTRIELYWTPNTNGGSASTNNNMTVTDNGVSITAPIAWQLQDGFIMLGNPNSSYEICHYMSQNGSALNGLIRGYAGTRPQAWPTGTDVWELNIMLAGMRMPVPYSVGDSSLTLSTPPGWKPILAKYMLAKFREAEQERQEAASLFKEFTDWFTQYAKSNKQIAGPRQVRMFDDYGIRGVVPGGLSGGIIVP